MEKRIAKFMKHPKKAMFTLALPILIAMFVQTMYNIVDTAFVGRLGAEAIAAVTFSFPIFLMLMGLNQGVSVGAGSRISRYLGAKNKKQAENTAIHGLILTVVLAVILLVFGIIFLRQIFSVFGASNTVMELGMGYMHIIFIGIVFMFTAFYLHNVFVAQGDTKTPMKVQISALLLNMILDPIFIYGFKLGVRGAAIATVCTFTVSLLMILYYLEKKSYLRFKLRNFNFSWKIVREILFVGMPAGMTLMIISVLVTVVNKLMADFGTKYVAAFGIVTKLESVSITPIIAFATATLTLVGMFYGAKRYELVKSTVWYGMKVLYAITLTIGLVFFIFPSLFLKIFTTDSVLLGLGIGYLRINVFTFPLMACGHIMSRAMQGMGYGLPGLVINVVRVFVFSIPLAYIFVYVFGLGYLSIAVAMVLGGIASNIVAIIWFEWKIHKMNH